MAETYTVEAQLIADISNYSSKLTQAARQMSGFESSTGSSVANIQKKISGIGKGMMVAGAGITAMGAKSLKSFGTFNQSLNSAAVIAGGTSKDINGLADVANKMGAILPLSAQDSADAMVAMARDGASISDIKKEFPSIAQAATAAGSDLQQTAGVVQNAMNIWGKSIGSPQQAAATLVTTANLSNASVEDMQHALATIGATANLAGMSMQDTSSAIGLLTNQGFSAADASQDLNHAILQMMAPSDKASGLMKELGLSFKDSNGNMKPFKQIASEVAKATDGMGKADKAAALKTIFHSAGMKAMVPIMKAVEDKTGDTKTSWDAFTGAVNKSTKSQAVAAKTLSDQAEEMQKNVGAKIEQVGGNWESLSNKAMASKSGVSSTLLDWTNGTLNWAQSSNSMFAKVTRDFIGLAPVIGPATTAIGGFLANAGKITSTVSSAGGALVSAKKSVGDFMSSVSAAGGFSNWIKQTKLWSAATKVATAVQTAFTAVQTAGLLPWIIGATIIAAVAAALIYWITQTKSGQAAWQAFTTWLSNTWSGMVEFFTNIWNSITNGLTVAATAMSNAWTTLVNWVKGLWNGLTSFFTTLWSNIVSISNSTWQGIVTFMQPLIATISSLWSGLSTTLSGIWNGIKSVASGVWNLIKAVILGPILILLDALTGNWKQMAKDANMIWNSIKSAVGSIVSGLVQIVTSLINGLAGVLNTIWRSISSVAMSIWNSIKSGISSIWRGIVSFVTNSANAVKNGVSNAWNALPGIASNIWNGVKSTISNIMSGLIGAVSSLGSSIVSGLQGAWSSLTGMVSGIWNGVKSAITSALNFDISGAGRAIMESFYNGLKAVWGKVQDFVGGIAGWVRDHKGPISYDKRLLIPAGKAIMNGLNGGLNHGFRDVMSNVSGMAGNIANVVSGSADYRINAVANGLDIGTDGTLSVDMTQQQQPATINLSMGGSTYRGFVDDISNQQGQTATLNRASIV